MRLRTLSRALLLAAGALALAAAPARAQVIPTSPRGGRPPQRPPARPAPGDTVPEDSASARPVVQDSLIDALLRLEGYTPVEYQGDSAQFDNAQRTLRLRGNPVVTRQETKLESTDSIVYRERSRFVEIYGSPHVTGEGQDIRGNVIYYDLEAERASVQGAKTAINEGATWYVQGNVTSEEQGTRVYATGSTFTSDDREDPAYYFKADKIKVVRNRILVGRPAYLYFRNVPVFVLPFIVQDLARGRRSGVLIPEFDINDIVRTNSPNNSEAGTGRQIGNLGYYWAINQYMGAQFAFEWRSQSWTALTAGYQFNWRRRFLNGDLSYQQFWRDQGADSRNLRGSASWQPDERTNLNTSLNYASSTRFERDRSVDPFRQTSEISSTFSLTRRADWGQIATGAELRQDISTDDQRLGTRFSVSPQTINLFPAGAGGASWYNDAALTLGGDVSYTRNTRAQGLSRRLADDENASANLTSNVRFGPIGVGGGVQYTRELRTSLAAIDSADAADGVTGNLGFIPGLNRQTLGWSASTGYEFRLIGSTRLTPNVSVSQQLVRRDTVFPPLSVGTPTEQAAYGRFVAAQPRTNFGAALNTELYGFFPGFGAYSAIRHKITPGLRYTYSPTVRQNAVQDIVFGVQGGREVNEVTFSFDQTFEAKRRTPVREARDSAIARTGTGNPQDAGADSPGALPGSAVPSTPGDSTGAAADSTGQPRSEGPPDQAQKVTLLAINTTALAYSFVPVDTFGTRFQTGDITNTLRSDLFGGLNVTLSHDLFAEERVAGSSAGVRRGRFSPFLTAVQTQVSFGANSALFRWLGFARATEAERGLERGRTPAGEGVPSVDPPGAQTSTGRSVSTDPGGNWNVSLGYSLRRARANPLDTIPGRAVSRNSQNLSTNVSFYPTRNWAVSWQSQYSVTEGEFGTHVLNLKRDLYRWQANFDFVRAPNGNTSFSFSVHLTDLPDLKADYRRSNLGGSGSSF